MINEVDLTDWKTQREILNELNSKGINITSRSWRTAVEKWNKRFSEGLEKKYITHSNQYGFKATSDIKEAKIGINDYISRSRDMEKKVREALQGFEHLNNFKFNFDDLKQCQICGKFLIQDEFVDTDTFVNNGVGIICMECWNEKKC